LIFEINQLEGCCVINVHISIAVIQKFNVLQDRDYTFWFRKRLYVWWNIFKQVRGKMHVEGKRSYKVRKLHVANIARGSGLL
jgi:hypothetical protein